MRFLKWVSLIFFLPAFAFAGLVEKTVDYKIDGKSFRGYYVAPEGKDNLPGILVVHDWLGLTDKTKEKAREIAELGFVVFAADVYGVDTKVNGPQEAGQTAGIYKHDRKKFRQHLWAAYDTMLKQDRVEKGKTAAVGFCFGGTGVLEMARSGDRLKGVVSFHGGLDAPKPFTKKFTTKVIALHGADDPFVSASDLADFEQELREAKADWRLVKYGGAVHSFTDKTAGTDNTKGAAYNEAAHKRSWQEMKNFFAEIF